ncbi:hypothetical protein DRQ20_04970 [bacterium]|nr:MAG: hypothetical protein DRQ20_04970 [bacterium]
MKGEKVEIHKEFDMLTREEKVLPSIHHISFSFDRHYMAFIYGFEEPSFLYLYEIDKKKLKQISPAGKNVELSGYAWSPSGDVIAVGYQRLKLVDVTTQQEIFTIDSVVNKGTGGIFVLEWNKNGLLYAKTEDGLNNAFFVWDGREKKAIKDMARWVINGRTQRIEKISFNEMDPEKREIFFSPDSTVFIYLVEKPIDTMRGIFKTHLYLERRK